MEEQKRASGQNEASSGPGALLPEDELLGSPCSVLRHQRGTREDTQRNPNSKDI